MEPGILPVESPGATGGFILPKRSTASLKRQWVSGFDTVALKEQNEEGGERGERGTREREGD